MGNLVLPFDIEPESADVAVFHRELLNELVHPAIHAFAAVLFNHVDALDPPEVTVPPITPLEGDHHATDNLFVLFDHDVEAGLHAAADCLNAGA